MREIIPPLAVYSSSQDYSLGNTRWLSWIPQVGGLLEKPWSLEEGQKEFL